MSESDSCSCIVKVYGHNCNPGVYQPRAVTAPEIFSGAKSLPFPSVPNSLPFIPLSSPLLPSPRCMAPARGSGSAVCSPSWVCVGDPEESLLVHMT